jgi:hypothetical protein
MASRSKDLTTPLARAAFLNVLKPRTQDDGKQSYGATLLFPKSTDISVLKDAALVAMKEEWGDKSVEWFKNGLIKNPFLDGDGPQGLNKKTGERYSGFEGCTFIRTSATLAYPPMVFDKNVKPIIHPDGIYSGCYVYAVVHCFTWEHPSNGKGLTFGLNMIQFAKDGDRFSGGGADPNAHFTKIEDEGAAPESTKTGAGAAGLFG